MKAELTNMSQNHSTPRNERNMKFANTSSYHDHAGHMYFEKKNFKIHRSKNSKAPIGACKAPACSLAMRPLASWTITTSMAQRWSCAAVQLHLGPSLYPKTGSQQSPHLRKLNNARTFAMQARLQGLIPIKQSK